jgi:uncharacterized protein YjbJ (UPF0337 family)
MSSDRIHGNWRQMKGWALENWGRVVRDPWLRIAGRRERLLGMLEASLCESRRRAEADFPAPASFARRGSAREAQGRLTAR